MPHSSVAVRIHYVFSNQGRRHLVPRDLEERIWAFIGGIARENGMIALAAGGLEDHIQVLGALPAEMSPRRRFS